MLLKTKLVKTTVLTPALSSEERENRSPSTENSRARICRTRIRKTKTGQSPFPLPGGEEKGEGELNGDYYLDFFCEEAELNVELDGNQHGFPDQQEHDAEREKFLQSRGIKTLRFWNSHLRRNAQGIRDTIFSELQSRAPHPLPEYTRPMKSVRKS